MHVMQSSATVFLIDQMEFHNRNTRARMHAKGFLRADCIKIGRIWAVKHPELSGNGAGAELVWVAISN